MASKVVQVYTVDDERTSAATWSCPNVYTTKRELRRNMFIPPKGEPGRLANMVLFGYVGWMYLVLVTYAAGVMGLEAVIWFDLVPYVTFWVVEEFGPRTVTSGVIGEDGAFVESTTHYWVSRPVRKLVLRWFGKPDLSPNRREARRMARRTPKQFVPRASLSANVRTYTGVYELVVDPTA